MQRGWVLAFVAFAQLLAAAGALDATTVVPLVDLPPAIAYEPAAAEVLRGAAHSIDLLLSSGRLNGVSLWEELAAAAARGVVVRVLLDQSDWAPSITAGNRPVLDALRAQGIDARFDDPEVTTHAKLLIVDARRAIVGSVNWNRYALGEHRQASLIIDDPDLVEPFAAFFDRLWRGELPNGGMALVTDPLSAERPTFVPLPDATDTALYAETTLACLGAARRSVHVVMYRMSYYPSYPTSIANRLLDALIDAAGRGLDVRVVLDDCAPYAESAKANLEAATMLRFQGVAVRLDDPAITTHAKLVIIDGETVLLGSTNWNYYSLEQNVEADLALIGVPSVAATFDAFFEALWREARPLL